MSQSHRPWEISFPCKWSEMQRLYTLFCTFRGSQLWSLEKAVRVLLQKSMRLGKRLQQDTRSKGGNQGSLSKKEQKSCRTGKTINIYQSYSRAALHWALGTFSPDSGLNSKAKGSFSKKMQKPNSPLLIQTRLKISGCQRLFPTARRVIYPNLFPFHFLQTASLWKILLTPLINKYASRSAKLEGKKSHRAGAPGLPRVVQSVQTDTPFWFPTLGAHVASSSLLIICSWRQTQVLSASPASERPPRDLCRAQEPGSPSRMSEITELQWSGLSSFSFSKNWCLIPDHTSGMLLLSNATESTLSSSPHWD